VEIEQTGKYQTLQNQFPKSIRVMRKQNHPRNLSFQGRSGKWCVLSSKQHKEDDINTLLYLFFSFQSTSDGTN